MAMVLTMHPAARSGQSVIVYDVHGLPEAVKITIEKIRGEEAWCIVRNDQGSALVRQGRYDTAEEALAALRDEFPG